MPCCSAFGCCNNTSKGYKLYRFPSNPNSRRIWESRLRRKDWHASNNSRLCEVHFEPHMFEPHRQDGKKKLKWTAVPTIFSHKTPVKHRKPPKNRGPETSKDIGQAPIVPDHTYCTTGESSEKLDDEMVEADDLASSTSTGVGLTSTPCAGCVKSKELINTLNRRIKQLEAQVAFQNTVKRRLNDKMCNQTKNLGKLFRRDQLRVLGCKSARGVRWSTETLKMAMQIRFACGASGYGMLLKQHYPLPSIRTLQKATQHISFQPGILTQIFDYMKFKVQTMLPVERLCCLTLDEMAITPGIDYDASTGSLLGHVNLPGHEGIATHGLVFMLSGLSTRWKQTVAYYYTGNSTNGKCYKDIILNIVHKAEEIGLHVISVTSDMGSPNRAMWNAFGICASRDHVVNKIVHPECPDKWLYFLADPPHLIKNVKAAFISGQEFTFSQSICASQMLPTHVASVQVVQDLASFQENLVLKIAPNLNCDMLKPAHFDKMKVSEALHVFSNSVSSGVRYLVEKEGRSVSYLTSAWFIEIMNRWFDLVSSRNLGMALSKANIEKYSAAVEFLCLVKNIFLTLAVGEKKTWKPFQTGMLLSTTSVLELSEEVLSGGYKYLLTSRLSQDCLENLFSSVRLTNAVPTPCAFKQRLKTVCLSQFLKSIHNGSYEDDDNDFLLDLPDMQPTAESSEELQPIMEIIDTIDNAEGNSLYYLIGYCINSIRKQTKLCDSCLSDVLARSDEDTDMSLLTELKEYSQGSLVHVSNCVMHMLHKTELVIRQSTNLQCIAGDIRTFLLNKALQETQEYVLKSCHNIKRKLIKKYISVRIHIFCRQQNRELQQSMKKKGQLGSKSLCMRALVKKIV